MSKKSTSPEATDCRTVSGRSPAPGYASPCGRVTLYRGDCLEIIGGLEGVDAVVSDPPYGIGYVKGKGGRGIHSNRKRNIKAIIGDDKPFDPTPLLRFSNVMVWGADHYAQKLPRGRWLAWDKLAGKESWDSFSDVEFAWHSKSGAARIHSYLWKGLCQGAGEDKNTKRNHPTQKPVRLMRWCIEEAGVKEGETVLDPYMGSGSTIIAAIRTGRRAIGIEKDPEHFKNAVERIKRELAQGDLFLGHNR